MEEQMKAQYSMVQKGAKQLFYERWEDGNVFLLASKVVNDFIIDGSDKRAAHTSSALSKNFQLLTTDTRNV